MAMFDFGKAMQEEEAWEGSLDAILPAGNHRVKIIQVDPSQPTSSGNAQLQLRMANQQGSIRDWVVITERSIGRLLQVLEAAGVPRPDGAKNEINPMSGELSVAYANRLLDREVAIRVGDEPDYKDPTLTRQRVQSYHPANLLPPAGEPRSDIPTMEDPPPRERVTSGTLGPEDIPFKHDTFLSWDELRPAYAGCARNAYFAKSSGVGIRP